MAVLVNNASGNHS
jgi:hypothetical protein